MYGCAPREHLVHGSQRRPSDPLGLELLMVVSCPCGYWNSDCESYAGAASALSHGAISPALTLFLTTYICVWGGGI